MVKLHCELYTRVGFSVSVCKMYFFCLLESESLGVKTGGDNAAWGGEPQQGLVAVHTEMLQVWKGAVLGCSSHSSFLAPSPVAHFENLGQAQWPGPQAESSSVFPER